MIKKPKRNMRKFKLYSLTVLAMAGVLFACSTSPKTDEPATKISEINAAPSVKPDTNLTQNEVFLVVEDMPTFPGGEKALMNYLSKNIHYPEKAKEAGIHGRVFVNFIVEPDGSIDHVKILRGIGGGCDLEAFNVVKNMPKWNPGKQKGKPVRVSFNLPIRFSLK